MRRSTLKVMTEVLGILLSPVEEANRKDCQKTKPLERMGFKPSQEMIILYISHLGRGMPSY